MIVRRKRASKGTRQEYSYSPMIWVHMPDGGRKQVWGGTFRTKVEAKAEERRLLQERDAGANLQRSKMTVAEVCKQYLDEKANRVKASSLIRSRQLLDLLLPHLGKIPVASLKPIDISKAYNALLAGSAKRTVRHAHWQLHGALDQAVNWGQIPLNVAARVEPPKPESFEGRALNPEELARLLEVARSSPIATLVVMAVDSSARQGELLALRWSSVDLDGAKLHIGQSVRRLKGGFSFSDPKTKHGKRTVEISPPALAVLRTHRHDQLQQRLRAGELWADADLVFTTDTGRPVDGSFVSRVFKRIAAEAGLEGLRFHDLRHSSVSLLLQNGELMANVSRRAGHANIGVTVDTYGHRLGTDASMAATMGGILGSAIKNPDGWLANG